MVRKLSSDNDDWHSVTDLKKRKQIQDRLAQRARRKRLREAKNKANGTAREDETRSQDEESSQATPSDAGPNYLISSTCPFSFNSTAIDMSTMDGKLAHAIDSNMRIFEEDNHLPFSPDYPAVVPESITPNPTFPMTVFSALYINGQILGLSCSTTVPAKSILANPGVPLSLHPTDLQLTTIHARWIDRLPSSKARDNMISLSGIIDDEEVLRDFYCMPSFELVPGMAPWDPNAWKITKSFAEKWGFIFL